MTNPSRRNFLKLSAAAAGGAIALHSVPTWALPARTVAVVPPLSPFEYSQVQLSEGLFRTQFEHNHELFLGLEEDALLKPFRQRAGLPAPGRDMGGWYDNARDFDPTNNFHGFIPGHSFGQYLSALARAYAVTGSKGREALLTPWPTRLPAGGICGKRLLRDSNKRGLRGVDRRKSLGRRIS